MFCAAGSMVIGPTPAMVPFSPQEVATDYPPVDFGHDRVDVVTRQQRRH
jgi:hypothetical protein